MALHRFTRIGDGRARKINGVPGLSTITTIGFNTSAAESMGSQVVTTEHRLSTSSAAIARSIVAAEISGSSPER
jgi:hypothetical protein